jgi:hypothetical protein
LQPLATREAEIRRIVAQGQSGKIVQETPISKITRAKWSGGVARVVDHLLGKCEALNSNPSPIKTKSQQTKKAAKLKDWEVEAGGL